MIILKEVHHFVWHWVIFIQFQYYVNETSQSNFWHRLVAVPYTPSQPSFIINHKKQRSFVQGTLFLAGNYHRFLKRYNTAQTERKVWIGKGVIIPLFICRPFLPYLNGNLMASTIKPRTNWHRLLWRHSSHVTGGILKKTHSFACDRGFCLPFLSQFGFALWHEMGFICF